MSARPKVVLQKICWDHKPPVFCNRIPVVRRLRFLLTMVILRLPQQASHEGQQLIERMDMRRVIRGDVLYTAHAASRRKVRFRTELDDEGALVLPLIFRAAVHASGVEDKGGQPASS